MPKKKKKFDWPSLPIMNYCNVMDDHDCNLMIECLKKICTNELGSLTSYHTKMLGKQKLCYTNVYRFWVWEGKNWRVFVNNTAGISFEVRAGLSLEQAWEELTDYLLQLKIKND